MSTPIIHPTEKMAPEQCKMFREVIERMYSTHLDKNQDYSKYNILATGFHGVVTRIWDKTARLMSLAGFNIGTGEYTGEKSAKNESIEDTLIDLANYAVIALILRRNKWGK